MNILSLFASPVNKIIDSIGNAIDRNVTNDEERLTLQNALVKMKTDAELEMKKLELQYESELTKRLEADMRSDNKLSKNIRPYLLVFLTGIVTILAISDGNISFDYTTVVNGAEVVQHYSFTIKEMWANVFGLAWGAAISFYFGGRSYEKGRAITKGSDND